MKMMGHIENVHSIIVMPFASTRIQSKNNLIVMQLCEFTSCVPIRRCVRKPNSNPARFARFSLFRAYLVLSIGNRLHLAVVRVAKQTVSRSKEFVYYAFYLAAPTKVELQTRTRYFSYPGFDDGGRERSQHHLSVSELNFLRFAFRTTVPDKMSIANSSRISRIQRSSNR